MVICPQHLAGTFSGVYPNVRALDAFHVVHVILGKS